MNNNLLSGFKYLADGFRLIFQPGLKRFVIIPLLINTFFFIGLFYFAHYYFSELNQWVMSYLPAWLNWLGYLLWLIFFIGFALVFVFTFMTFANLIAAPFNGLLAEKIEYHLTRQTFAPRSTWEIIKDIPRILGRQFAIIGFYLPRALVLLLLFFVPIIQIAAALLWFLFNAWFMTLQYVDYPTDNHHIPLAKVRTWLSTCRWTTLGLGSGIVILSMVPLVNFLIVPAAVAAATKFWIENKDLVIR